MNIAREPGPGIRPGIKIIAIHSNDGDKISISPVTEGAFGIDDKITAIGNNRSIDKLEWI